jgi:hypothetical protein
MSDTEDGIDHFPDSYWLGQHEDSMITMLDLLDAGGSVDDLPSQPVVKTMTMSASYGPN